MSSRCSAGAQIEDTNWINTIKSNFSFWGGGKPEFPEKTSRCRVENQQTQLTFWRRILESNPGHIGGRRVLKCSHHCDIPCTPSGFSDCLVKWCGNFGRDFKLVGLCCCMPHLFPSAIAPGLRRFQSVSTLLELFPKLIWFWHVQSMTKLRKMLYPCSQVISWLISKRSSYSYRRNRSY